jgi:hypothetical protein
MDSQFKHTTVLADLGPLPEVVESDSETLWKMFVELDEQHTSSFTRTQPSTITPLTEAQKQPAGGYSVQEVMAEARRNNRVCPKEHEWQQLHAVLGRDAPAPLTGTELKKTPPLLRRIRLRDQVEWAAQKEQLVEVMDFLQRLREDQWMHMGV